MYNVTWLYYGLGQHLVDWYPVKIWKFSVTAELFVFCGLYILGLWDLRNFRSCMPFLMPKQHWDVRSSALKQDVSAFKVNIITLANMGLTLYRIQNHESTHIQFLTGNFSRVLQVRLNCCVSTFYRPHALHVTQPNASKHWRMNHEYHFHLINILQLTEQMYQFHMIKSGAVLRWGRGGTCPQIHLLPTP